MVRLNPNLWSTLAVCVVLVPRSAPAQTIANSFEEIRQILKTGETVVVTDVTGQRTRGKVAEVSASSLVILNREARTFAEGAITEIRVTDSVSNGALIGAAVGTGFALWDYLIDPSEPGNAAVFTVAIALGAAAGAGIDALINRRGTLLYAPSRQTRRLTISPVRLEFVIRRRGGAGPGPCSERPHAPC